MAEGQGLRTKSELTQRVASGLVMVSGALLVAWIGGWPFLLLWLALSVAVSFEWAKVVGVDNPGLVAGGTAIALGACAYGLISGTLMLPSLVLIAGLGLAAHGAGAAWRLWGAMAVPYALAIFVPTILLRGWPGGSGTDGFVAILFVYAAVWMTDIGAYFSGRRFGGPKFAPRISPKKTWSGVAGGMVCGTLAAALVLVFAGYSVRFWHIAVAVALAIAVVFGDLFESYLKRRFGVKDAGSLIPGHGGFMDRLDGYVAAALLAALAGIAVAGWQNVAAGLVR